MTRADDIRHKETLKYMFRLDCIYASCMFYSGTGKLAHACSPNPGSQSQRYEDCSQISGQSSLHNEFQVR